MTRKRVRPTDTIFPNLNSSLGSYDPLAQAITLDCVDQVEFQAMQKNIQSPELAKKMGVLLHEIRHHVDHIATLWGHRHILALQKAAYAIAQNSEYGREAVVDYIKQQRQTKHTLYYHETYSVAKFNGQPWAMRPSTGLKFNSDGAVDKSSPIVFAQISSYDGTKLCRSPVTIASLLEVSAVSQEINFQVAHHLEFAKEDAPVYLKIYTDELLKNLVYEQELVMYNVAAHILANAFSLNDIPSAYLYASRVAALVLNMPPEYLERIPVSERFRDDKGSYQRVERAVLNNDAGAIFYVLVTNYAKNYKRDKKFSLAELLRVNNLPDEKEFFELVKGKMLLTVADAGLGKFWPTYYTDLLLRGYNVFLDRGIDGAKANDTTVLVKYHCLPHIFLDDTIIPEPASMDESDAEEQAQDAAFRYHYTWALQIRMDDFYNIRGL